MDDTGSTDPVVDLSDLRRPDDSLTSLLQQIVWQKNTPFRNEAKQLFSRYCEQATYSDWHCQEVLERFESAKQLPKDLKDLTPQFIVNLVRNTRGGTLTESGLDVFLEIQVAAHGTRPSHKKKRGRHESKMIDRAQDVIILRAYGGGTMPKDISARLNISPAMVSAALARGRSKWRCLHPGEVYTGDLFKEWCKKRRG